MMKLFLLFTIILISVPSVYSQKIKVPSAVKDTFNIMFPNAVDVKWGKENATEYEADFKLDDVKMSANFKSDGKWVETETEIDITALPQPVTDGINRDYPDAVILSASKVDKPGKNALYEAELKVNKKKKEVTYDSFGNNQ